MVMLVTVGETPTLGGGSCGAVFKKSSRRKRGGN